MAWDWQEIRRLVKEDRDIAGLSQARYGAPFNLSQGLISKVETLKQSEMTRDLEKMLLAKFSRIPESAAAPARADKTHKASARAVNQAGIYIDLAREIDELKKQIAALTEGRRLTTRKKKPPDRRTPGQRRAARSAGP